MNFRLTKDIYGTPWHVDPITFSRLTQTLEYYKNGGVFSPEEEKSNQFGIIPQSQAFTATTLERMDEIPSGSIAVYNFDSVITKHGGLSHYGTAEIAKQFSEMDSNENILGHVFFVESGGGASNAVKYMRDVAKKEVRNKPLVTYFEDLNASAAYYISSDSDYIIANSEEALVGSIGTMIQFSGYKSGEEDKTGQRHMRIYATKSVNKNAEYEKAINELDASLVINKMLNPINEEFINTINANRPNIGEAETSGAIFRAGDSIGKLVDEIGTMSTAIDKIYELSNKQKTAPTSGVNNNSKTNKMTKEEFKAQNPTAYAEIVNEGVAQERDRVEAWVVFNEINPAKVKAGIESGEVMKQKAISEFSLESMKSQKINEMEKENQKEVTTEPTFKTPEELAEEKQKSEMDELFKK